MVKKQNLITVAGIVWALAGTNILLLGIGALTGFSGWSLAAIGVGAAVVFFLFHAKVFSPMIAKHANRIRAFDRPKLPVWKFFDAKGYVMMAIMMGGGIALRLSGLVPDWFIAFFYTGIGTALAVAGLSFLLARIHKPGWRFHGNVLHHLHVRRA